MDKLLTKSLRQIGNILGLGVGVLGLLAIIFRKLNLLLGLVVLATILFMIFISMIVYQINKLENSVLTIEENYKRTKELEDIKSRIGSLELNYRKK